MLRRFIPARTGTVRDLKGRFVVGNPYRLIRVEVAVMGASCTMLAQENRPVVVFTNRKRVK